LVRMACGQIMATYAVSWGLVGMANLPALKNELETGKRLIFLPNNVSARTAALITVEIEAGLGGTQGGSASGVTPQGGSANAPARPLWAGGVAGATAPNLQPSVVLLLPNSGRLVTV
jgi:hypothetical protein